MTDINWGDITTIRSLAGVTTEEFSDLELTEFLEAARKEVNSKIMTRIYREPVLYIDEYRTNKVDGSNTTYFFRNWKSSNRIDVPPNLINSNNSYNTNATGNFNYGTYYYDKNYGVNYIADFNFDNKIDTSDVRLVQYNPNSHTESDVTISSIDIPNCSLSLSTPLSNVKLFVSYAYCPVDPTTPDEFISQCVNYLASAYTFIGNDGFIIKFGNVSIQPGQSGGKGKQLHEKYLDLLNQLMVNSFGGTLFGSMEITI
jgi:hypothetical protein